MKTRGPQSPVPLAPPRPGAKAASKTAREGRGDGGEFAELLAGLRRAVGDSPKTGTSAAGVPAGGPAGEARGGPRFAIDEQETDAFAGAGPASAGGEVATLVEVAEVAAPPTVALTELAERLVTSARLVRAGDRAEVDLRLAGGDSGIHRARIVRHPGGRFEIALFTESAAQRRVVEGHLEGLATALEQRGLTTAALSVEARPAVAEGHPAFEAAQESGREPGRQQQGDGQGGDDSQQQRRQQNGGESPSSRRGEGVR